MKQITVTERESGQRLDRLLSRYLREAPKGFLYKMLRKKNITLNGKKAQGNETLLAGDVVCAYLADETWEKFGGIELPPGGMAKKKDRLAAESRAVSEYCGQEAFSPAVREFIPPKFCSLVPSLVPGIAPPEILYEDGHILLFNKPAGILSQKAAPDDVSLVEYLTAYLLCSGQITERELQTVHPAICSRLDRNTTGIVAAGKTLSGLRAMNGLLKDRSLRKYYRCIVCGNMRGTKLLRGWLRKEERTNRVFLSDMPAPGAKPIETEYHALVSHNGLTLLEVHLITGRSHQIRAHLSSVGYPVLGDPKYGDAAMNRKYRVSAGVTAQLLHAYRLEFPGNLPWPLEALAGRSFCAPEPEIYKKLIVHG